MELNYFKDKIFDTINEGKELAITDIEAVDRENKLYVTVEDGTRFEITIGIAE